MNIDRAVDSESLPWHLLLQSYVFLSLNQIKDLTYQVAKMERKLEARAKSDEANKGLSRELEAQKHFLENQVDKLTCVNQQVVL